MALLTPSQGGSNTYKLELPRDMTIFATFNVGDLSPYVEDDIGFGDLRANSFEMRGGQCRPRARARPSISTRKGNAP